MVSKRIAVITGASRGIGSFVARGLAADGYHCALVARSAELLERQAAQIIAEGGTATCYPMDLAHVSNISKLCEELGREFGRCDLLLNNAGIWAPGLFETSVDVWSELLATNLTAPLYLMKLLHPFVRMEKFFQTLLHLNPFTLNMVALFQNWPAGPICKTSFRWLTKPSKKRV